MHRPAHRRAVLALVALALPLAGATPAPRARAARGPARALSSVEQQLVVLINRHRARAHLPPLTPAPLLNQVAFDHSSDMVRRHFFSHDNPDGRSPFDRIRRAGYHGGAMAENIAAGSSDAAGTFRQWRTSSGHNRNMLGRAYRAVGIGRAPAPDDPLGFYWTAVFGDRVE